MKPTLQELQVINSRLPGTSLSESQIEILPFRLFDNQTTDRHTTMSIEMMRKLVKDANEGRIAMNSLHKSSSTLPVGRSVEARLISTGSLSEVQVKMYTVTQRPDGTAMEDGKDLADRYNTGAVYACSAGVWVGYYKCSICGNDIRDWQNCDHYPGEVYVIEEKPTICTALMTGKDIQDGIAMDCGCYECSAVTAGGVRNASILTETFNQYDKSLDIKEFKKVQFEKPISDCITLTPYINTNKEEVLMAEQDSTLLQKNYELIEQKAKVEVEYATIKGEFAIAQSNLVAANTKLASLEAEFESIKANLAAEVALKDEFSVKLADSEALLAVSKTEFEAKEKELESTLVDLNLFKTAFISVVESNGTKINREADYSSKSISELTQLNEEYLAEIAKLPSGQQSNSNDENLIVLTNIYAGIPDEMFKSN